MMSDSWPQPFHLKIRQYDAEILNNWHTQGIFRHLLIQILHSDSGSYGGLQVQV